MTLKPTTLFASCCSALLVLAACGTQTVGSRYVKSENVLASQGKTIAVSAQDSALLAGTSLDIPSGALTQDTFITLELGMDTLVDADSAAGPVAIWGPAGTRFSKPARMTLPLSVNESGDEISILVREADGTEFEVPSSAVTIDAQGRAVFDINGFTSFQPVRRRPCLTNAACTPRQVCRAGRCVRPTTCSANSACPMGQVCVNGTCDIVTACPADAMLCPDGSSVSRTGPNCTFPGCPSIITRDGGAVTCPQDARLCPDGSSVGRTGPNCTFPACPGDDGGVSACSRDAFLCPDGTVVGRTGPRCEFVCPIALDGGAACSPVACTLACQYGFARDPSTGCEVCSCNPAPALDGGPIACTADAFQCPDGTFVGRSGPRCEFVCPVSDAGVCSPVVCTLACQYGFATDPLTGCEQCRCNPGPTRDGGAAPCFRGGCSNQLCSDQPGLGSTCEWRPEYACYQQAACERQPNGTCGHTPSPTLTACVAAETDGGVGCTSTMQCAQGQSCIAGVCR